MFEQTLEILAQTRTVNRNGYKDRKFMIRCRLVKFRKTPYNQTADWSNHVGEIAEVFQNCSYAAIGYVPFDHDSR